MPGTPQMNVKPAVRTGGPHVYGRRAASASPCTAGARNGHGHDAQFGFQATVGGDNHRQNSLCLAVLDSEVGRVLVQGAIRRVFPPVDELRAGGDNFVAQPLDPLDGMRVRVRVEIVRRLCVDFLVLRTVIARDRGHARQRRRHVSCLRKGGLRRRIRSARLGATASFAIRTPTDCRRLAMFRKMFDRPAPRLAAARRSAQRPAGLRTAETERSASPRTARSRPRGRRRG